MHDERGVVLMCDSGWRDCGLRDDISNEKQNVGRASYAAPPPQPYLTSSIDILRPRACKPYACLPTSTLKGQPCFLTGATGDGVRSLTGLLARPFDTKAPNWMRHSNNRPSWKQNGSQLLWLQEAKPCHNMCADLGAGNMQQSPTKRILPHISTSSIYPSLVLPGLDVLLGGVRWVEPLSGQCSNYGAVFLYPRP